MSFIHTRQAGKQALVLSALCAVVLTSAPPSSALPTDAAIHKILAGRAGNARGVGIVVGIVTPKGRRVVAYGGPQFDGDTIFEIGSVTKVFTALLLADMVRRREVALDDPAARYLSALRVPSRHGRAIELVDLATHTSALPFMTDEPPAAFLAHYELTRDTGSRWEYSNLGYWLLGEAITSRTRSDLESLLRDRITIPLKLDATGLTISPAMRARMAPGHDASLQPAPLASSVPLYATMAAAGGIVSSTNDLLTFLWATLGRGQEPFATDTRAMLATRRSMSATAEQALGWVIRGRGDEALIAHDGGTFGYASAVAWDPVSRTGVTVLMNEVGDVSDIAEHLLRPGIPLHTAPAASVHKEIALGEDVLDRYAGRYDAGDQGIFVMTRAGGVLTIAAPPDWGLPKLSLHPESMHDFFAREIPLRVAFELDRDGRVETMVIYPPRGQKPVRSKRLDQR